MIMNTFFKWLARIWVQLLTGNKPKELPQSLYESIPAPELRESLKTDDEVSIALIGQLVKIKRELKGEVAPEERTVKIIQHIITQNVPAVFRKNFINGDDRLYISHTDVTLDKERQFVNKEDFEKALPYIIKKLADLKVNAETSSGFLIVTQKDLASVAEKNDIEPVEEETDFTVNSTGIYR
jgi:hypothetical protein